MNLDQLISLFARTGCTRLYAKPLAENDNSKNQIYLAGAVESLNVFPSEEIFAENTAKGPSFKARLKFGWLLESGQVTPAPHAQLILYSQYPEVRFSGFLLGCRQGPSQLMADRQRAGRFSPDVARQLINRILFLGVAADGRTVGYVAAGNSEVSSDFNSRVFRDAFVVFREIPIAGRAGLQDSKERLLEELGRIHRLGWIDSKQLDSAGQLRSCTAPQCGGFTLEAELGIPKNSVGEPDFHGWEVKQHSVRNWSSLGDAITLMTPEPTGGYYKQEGVEAFIRRYGHPDRSNRPDRLNFCGRHRIGELQPSTDLVMEFEGYDPSSGRILDANGAIVLRGTTGEIAASWAFPSLLAHWSRKHARAVYVPSMRRTEPHWAYTFGSRVRLSQRTDSLRLLSALAAGKVYYDPGIKLENASTVPKTKRRSQFRIASRNIPALYETVEAVEV